MITYAMGAIISVWIWPAAALLVLGAYRFHVRGLARVKGAKK